MNWYKKEILTALLLLTLIVVLLAASLTIGHILSEKSDKLEADFTTFHVLIDELKGNIKGIEPGIFLKEGTPSPDETEKSLAEIKAFKNRIKALDSKISSLNKESSFWLIFNSAGIPKAAHSFIDSSRLLHLEGSRPDKRDLDFFELKKLEFSTSLNSGSSDAINHHITKTGTYSRQAYLAQVISFATSILILIIWLGSNLARIRGYRTDIAALEDMTKEPGFEETAPVLRGQELQNVSLNLKELISASNQQSMELLSRLENSEADITDFEQLFESLPLPFMVIDQPGFKILKWNQAAVRLLCSHEDPGIGGLLTRYLEFDNGSGSESLKKNINEGLKVADTYTTYAGLVREHSDEKSRILIKFSKQRSSSEERLIVAAVKTEDAVKEIEKTVDRDIAVFDSLPYGAVLLGADGEILMVNHAFLKLVEIKPEELEGFSYKALSSWHNIEEIKKLLLSKASSHWESTIQSGMINNQKYTNKYIPFFNSNGDIDGILLITEPAGDDADRDIDGMSDDEIMPEIGSMVRGIAHNLNSVIESILGYTSFLRDDTIEKHEASNKLRKLDSSANSARQLVSELLVTVGEKSYIQAAIPVDKILSEAVNEFTNTSKHNIKCVLNIDKEVNEIIGDPGLFRQIFRAILNESEKQMSRNGTINITTTNFHVNARLSEAQPGLSEGPHLMLKFIDEGTPRSKEEIGNLFAPVTEDNDESKGRLPWRMIYRIVKNHHGYISIEGITGVGNSITVYIPTKTQVMEKESPVPSEQSTELPKGSETVLVVDDEASIRELLSKMLNSLGYTVMEAAHGLEALKIVSSSTEEIDAVILDLVMPEMNGKDTFYRLHEINPNIKVLLCSGYSLRGTVKELCQKGASGFLQKPCRITDIAQTLRRILD